MNYEIDTQKMLYHIEQASDALHEYDGYEGDETSEQLMRRATVHALIAIAVSQCPKPPA